MFTDKVLWLLPFLLTLDASSNFGTDKTTLNFEYQVIRNAFADSIPIDKSELYLSPSQSQKCAFKTLRSIGKHYPFQPVASS